MQSKIQSKNIIHSIVHSFLIGSKKNHPKLFITIHPQWYTESSLTIRSSSMVHSEQADKMGAFDKDLKGHFIGLHLRIHFDRLNG
jgi:hypothetical protein